MSASSAEGRSILLTNLFRQNNILPSGVISTLYAFIGPPTGVARVELAVTGLESVGLPLTDTPSFMFSFSMTIRTDHIALSNFIYDCLPRSRHLS